MSDKTRQTMWILGCASGIIAVIIKLIYNPEPVTPIIMAMILFGACGSYFIGIAVGCDISSSIREKETRSNEPEHTK